VAFLLAVVMEIHRRRAWRWIDYAVAIGYLRRTDHVAPAVMTKFARLLIEAGNELENARPFGIVSRRSQD
jgi:hypothetical protein